MTESRAEQSAVTPWRHRLHTIVFEADTPAGRWFDTILLVLIVVSLVVVMLETVSTLPLSWRNVLRGAEWALTAIFTAEYVLRLMIVRRPLVYARSFFGLVDLLAILPTWVSLILPGAQALLAVRVLRLLRIFRVFKLTRYLSEA